MKIPLQQTGNESHCFNFMCCCKAHVAHRESDKFKILNDDDDPSLNKRIFEEIEKGEYQVFKPDFSKIKGLNDQRKDYFHRKAEINEIIRFLLNNKQVLIVTGPAGIGKTNSVSKAIQFVAEHEREAVEDGAYLIDMKGFNDINQLYSEIDNILELQLNNLTANSLISCNFIQSRKITLVLTNVN